MLIAQEIEISDSTFLDLKNIQLAAEFMVDLTKNMSIFRLKKKIIRCLIKCYKFRRRRFKLCFMNFTQFRSKLSGHYPGEPM